MHRKTLRQLLHDTPGLLCMILFICRRELCIVFVQSENSPADSMTKNINKQIHMRLSACEMEGTILELLVHGNVDDVKNKVSMAMMNHENCGLDLSPMNQMEHSLLKKLANEIDVLDQSEECLHQQKGTRRTGSQSVMNGIETMFLE